MIERIGTTRSGKPIELVWQFENGRRKVLSVSAFADSADNYDVFVTLEVKWWDTVWSKDPFSKTEKDVLRDLLEGKEFDVGQEGIARFGQQLGLRDSIERMEFGRRELLFPRFKRSKPTR